MSCLRGRYRDYHLAVLKCNRALRNVHYRGYVDVLSAIRLQHLYLTAAPIDHNVTSFFFGLSTSHTGKNSQETNNSY